MTDHLLCSTAFLLLKPFTQILCYLQFNDSFIQAFSASSSSEISNFWLRNSQDVRMLSSFLNTVVGQATMHSTFSNVVRALVLFVDLYDSLLMFLESLIIFLALHLEKIITMPLFQMCLELTLQRNIIHQSKRIHYLFMLAFSMWRILKWC